MSKLESLSKEDLIKFVKKQTVLLQKSRAKCEELEKCLEKTDAPGDTAAGSDRVDDENTEKQLSDLHSEVSKLTDELTNEKSRNDSLQRRLNELTDELECFRMKDETTRESVKFMQSEIIRLGEDLDMKNEEKSLLQENLNGLSAEKLQQTYKLEKTLDENQKLKSDYTDISNDLLNKDDRVASLQTEISTLKEELIKMSGELKMKEDINSNLISDMNSSELMFSDRSKMSEEEINNLKSTIAELKQELGHKYEVENTTPSANCDVPCSTNDVEQVKISQDDHISNLKNKLEELSNENVNLNQNCEEMKSKFDNQFKEIDNLMESVMEGISNESAILETFDNRSDWLSRVKGFVAGYRELNSKLSIAEYELNEVKGVKELLENESKCCQEQLKEWEMIMEMLKTDKENAVSSLEKADENLSVYKQTIKDVITNLQEFLNDADKEVLNDDVFHKESYDDLSTVAKLACIIGERLESLTEHLDKTNFEKEEVTLDLQLLSDRLKYLQQERDSAEQELETLKNVYKSAQDNEVLGQQECQQLKTDLDGYKKKVHDLEITFEKLGNIDHVFEQKFLLENEKITNAELLEKLNTEYLQSAELSAKFEERCQYVLELENKIMELTSKLTESKKKYENVSAQFDAHSNDLCNVCTDLKAAVEVMKNEKITLEQELGDKADLFITLESNKVELLERVEGLKSQLLLAESNLSREKDNVISFMSSLEQRENEISLLKDELASRDDRISDVVTTESTGIEYSSEREANLSDIEEQLNDLKVKLKETELKVEEIEAEKCSVEYNLNESESKVKEMEDKLKLFISEKNDISQRFEEIQERNETLEERISSSENEMNQASTENEVLKAQLSSAINEMSQFRDEVTHLRTAGIERDELKASNRMLVETKHNFEEQLERLQKEHSELLLQLDIVKKDHDNLTNSGSEMHQEVSLKAIEIGKLQEEIRDKTSLVLELEVDRNSTMDQYNELKSTYESFIKRVESEKHDLAEALKREEDNAEISNSKLIELKHQLNEFASEIEDLKWQNCDICEKYKSASEQICALSGQNTEIDNFQRTLYENLLLLLHDFSGFEVIKSDDCDLVTSDVIIAKCRGHVNLLTEHLNSLKKQNEIYQTQLSDLTEQLNSMSDTNSSNLDLLEKYNGLQEEMRVKDELCAKLKAIILKNKKELLDLTTKVNTSEREIESLEKVNTNLSNENDVKLAEAVKEMERGYKAQLSQLEIDCLHKQQAFDGMNDKCHEQQEKLEKKTEEIEIYLTKLSLHEDKMKSLQDELDRTISDHSNEIQSLKEVHENERSNLTQELNISKKQLLSLKEEAKSTSLIDLELADYERSIKKMHEQLQTRDSDLAEKDNEMKRLHERIAQLQLVSESSEKQFAQSEERANKLKQLLVKTKKDLSDIKKLENEQKMAEVQTKVQIEALLQDIEGYKIQLSKEASENARLRERCNSSDDSKQRAVRAADVKCQQLQKTLMETEEQLSTLQSDYDGYKVRVHNVLKQQKTRQQYESLLETEQAERRRFEDAAEQNRVKVKELTDEVRNLKKENETLLEEQERVIMEQQRVLNDKRVSELALNSRIEQISGGYQISVTKLEDVIQSLTDKNESIKSLYEDKLRELRKEQTFNLNVLTNRVKELESDNVQLQQDMAQQKASKQDGVQQRASLQPLLRVTEAETFIPTFTDMRNVERQSGEGSENVEEVACVQPHGSTSRQSVVPFNQLLSISLDDDTSVRSVTSHDLDGQMLDPGINVESLQDKLADSQKRIEHLTQLVNDGDVTAMRLSEQTRLLKDEVRRLERNREREDEIQNTEYLKNIILKFMSLKPGEERSRLLPVITTLLKLSDLERQVMHRAAVGEENDKNKTWGSYLHRWTSVT